MKRKTLFIKVIIIISLLLIILFLNIGYNKQVKLINKEKEQYNRYILSLSSIYSPKKENIIPPKLLEEELNNLLNYLERSDVIIVDELSKVSDRTSDLSLRIRKDYLLNFMKYFYDNDRSFNIESFSFVNIDDDYLKLSMVISYLYSLPVSNVDSYFSESERLNIRFWSDEVRMIEEKKLKESQQVDKQSIAVKDNVYLPPDKPPVVESQMREFNLQIKYKGSMKIGNQKYAIIEYNNTDIFIKENDIYKLENFVLKVLKVDNEYLTIEVDSKIYTYKLDIL
ncbi:MAG: hypothetical protein RMJ36_03880 [Candidatus Calescibacterium sp.]|nr:hypothetical protein [Candidatus Calescibacterium sp.]MDW8132776.1 hypothetical protein [Candidatus Calescibacterium sp.]